MALTSKTEEPETGRKVFLGTPGKEIRFLKDQEAKTLRV